MTEKQQLKAAWDLRLKLKKKETLYPQTKITNTEWAILEYIAASGRTTITDIKAHSYFSDTSLSTIKRAVTLFTKGGLLGVETSTEDARYRLLYIKD